MARWVPNESLELATVEGELDGGLLEDDLEPSEWVRMMMKGFGKFVGFPIAKFECQCMAFF